MFQRRRFKRRSGNNASTPGSRGSGSHYDPGNSSSPHNYGVGPLANFDACIEACDALAASSGKFGGGSYPQQQLKQNDHNDNDGDGDGAETLSSDSVPEFIGKSIMISPDGELLSNPTRSPSSSVISSIVDTIIADTERNHKNCDDDGTSTGGEEIKTSNSTLNENYGTALPPPSVKVNEVESTLYIGNDIVPNGEKALNGFSARGWNPIMTTMAIRRSVDTLQTTGKFVEELILTHKNSVANASQSCEQLRSMMMFRGRDDQPSLDNDNSKDGDHNNSNEQSKHENGVDGSSYKDDVDAYTPVQKSSAGPLLFPESTLYEALVGIEQYHSKIAEIEAHRLRMASSTSTDRGLDSGVLPTIQMDTMNNYGRADRRERALIDSQEQLAEAESNLRTKKEYSRKLWDAVYKVENEVNRKVEEKMRKRSRDRELRRRQEETERQEAFSDGKLNSLVTQQEILDLVAQVGADHDGSFAPHDLPPPNVIGPIDQTLSQSKSFDSPIKSPQQKESPLLPSIDDYTAELEEEYNLHELRVAAVESDENVTDAAGNLLNAISTNDTTKRSARIAAETCLMSCANAQMKCMKSLVALERNFLKERLEMINELEQKIENIDVRKDLDLFIEHEKSQVPNGTTSLGDNDDGGVASALATLNSFSEGIGVGVGVAGMAELSSFSGWNENEEGEAFNRDDLEEAVDFLFKSEYYSDEGVDPKEKETNISRLEESVQFLERAVSEKSIRARGYRASTCYALNNHRGKNTQLDYKIQYDGLCRVLNSLLDGCDREAADVANAKMVMMLAQTFYFNENNKNSGDRANRKYPKEKLCHHPIWLDEDFWTQALFQCVTDSLTNSGVMVRVRVRKSDRDRKMRWYDLNSKDRADAASQIHSVIFSQLGALAHSMVEFGCSVEQACAFVRRLSVRHQLPLHHRSMLLHHLINDKKESAPVEDTN